MYNDLNLDVSIFVVNVFLMYFLNCEYISAFGVLVFFLSCFCDSIYATVLIRLELLIL